MTSVRTNLGSDASDFIGRAEELAGLWQRFEHGRLVTLEGPPGVGKTRLARRHGREVVEQGRLRQVCFCSLASARTADAVLRGIANALEVSLDPRADTTEQVARAVASRRALLLILDNLEQVVEPARDIVATLLETAPDARLLVTTRRRLGLADEQVLRLEPLDEMQAAELFIRAARRHGVEVSHGPEIRDIVRHLEHLPLGIELAAARVRFFPPAAMLRRLEDSLRVFRADPDRPARQATLEGAVAWSWELLDDAQKDTLAQCAAFARPFRLEAAERVIALPNRVDVLEKLESLCEHSLLRVSVDRADALLDTFGFVARFAAQRLHEFGEEEVFRRHARHFVERGMELVARLDGPKAAQALAELDEDRDNLALVVERGEAFPELAVEAVAILARIFALRGPREAWEQVVSRGCEWAELTGDGTLRARMLRVRAQYETVMGQLERAQQHLEAVLDGLDASQEALRLDVALELANVARSRGDREVAQRVASRVHRRARELERRDLEGAALMLLGLCHLLEEPAAAMAELDQAARLLHEAGDVRREAAVRVNLGVAYLNEGQLAMARVYQTEALELSRELGDRRLEGAVRSNLGLIENHLGRVETSRQHLEEALAIVRRAGQRVQEGVVLSNLGAVMANLGDFDAAREHLVAGRRLQREASNAVGGAYVEMTLANIDHVEGALAQARGAYQAVMQIFEASKAASYQTECLLYLSVAHRELGDGEEAQVCARRALASARRDGEARWEALAAALLALYTDDVETSHVARTAARGAGPAVRVTADALLERARGREVSWIGGRVLLRAVEDAETAATWEHRVPQGPTLVVGPAGDWFQLEGCEPVDMRRRAAPRLILMAFVDHREQGADEGLSLDELFELGWPGQTIAVDAANKRVYSAVRTLRRLGLDAHLLTTDRGYMLDPSLTIARALNPTP